MVSLGAGFYAQTLVRLARVIVISIPLGAGFYGAGFSDLASFRTRVLQTITANKFQGEPGVAGRATSESLPSASVTTAPSRQRSTDGVRDRPTLVGPVGQAKTAHRHLQGTWS